MNLAFSPESLVFGNDSGSQILMGSIGWENEEDYYFLGTDANDGHTLIRVQLFDGRDYSQPLNPDRAQGHRIVCHISGGIFRIPPKDTRVFVAVPRGMEHVPGAGVIFATVEKNPTTQFTADRAVIDFGPDVHVVIKGKSVSLQDPDFRFLSVGTPRSGGGPGVQVHLPDGTGAAWQDGAFGCFVRAGVMLQMTPDKFEVWQGTGGSGTFLRMGSGEFWTYGPANKMQGAGCYIGKAPTAANTALWGPTGIAGLPSPSIFFSPI